MSITVEQLLEVEKRYTEPLQRQIDFLEGIVRECINIHGRTVEQAWDGVPREKWEDLYNAYIILYKH